MEDNFIEAGADDCIHMDGASAANCTIRRCVLLSQRAGIQFGTAQVANSGHVVENCIISGQTYGIIPWGVGGVTIRNCLFVTCANGVWTVTLPASPTANVVNNSIFYACAIGARSSVSGDMPEEYNTFWGNSTNRNNVSAGSNSVSYPPLFRSALLKSGIRLPWLFGELSNWSQIAALAGTGAPSEDLLGITRPTTSGKKSWGPIQFNRGQRETGTVRTGSASIKLADASRVQFFVPVTNVSTTISVYVRREASYAGTNPQMIIKQPGVADRTTTDAGSSGAWNQLTDTFTPSANTDFVAVELVSNNTATSGSFAVYFDDLAVS